MKRSVGVTIIAILSLVGSTLALAMGLFTAVMMGVVLFSSSLPRTETPLPPVFFKAMMVLAPLFYILPAVWGIVTGIGLLRLKNWARISIIVFSVLLIVFGVFGILPALVMPAVSAYNSDVDPAAMMFVRVFMIAVALTEVGVGIWWVLFFNRAGVKVQFAAPRGMVPGGLQYQAPYAVPAPISQVRSAVPLASNVSERPLSITIIGWYLLAVSLLVPLSLIVPVPAAVFTLLLTGWPKAVYLLAMTGVHVYIGVGLLRLQPMARIVGIGYCVYTILSSGVFFLAPGAQGRILKIMELQQSMFPWMKTWQEAFPLENFDITPFVIIGALGGIALELVLLYFIVKARPAFARST